MTRTHLAAVGGIIAVIAAWFAENAAIHAAGYTGFGGAGWITAILIPIAAGAGVYDFIAPDVVPSND